MSKAKVEVQLHPLYLHNCTSISHQSTDTMAALIAPTRRFALSPLTLTRPAWSLPCTPSSSKSTLPSPTSSAPSSLVNEFPVVESSYAASLSAPWYFPALPLLDALAELFPPILWAVPKHKVTHSRKSMRSANKGLKNKTSMSVVGLMSPGNMRSGWDVTDEQTFLTAKRVARSSSLIMSAQTAIPKSADGT